MNVQRCCKHCGGDLLRTSSRYSACADCGARLTENPPSPIGKKSTRYLPKQGLLFDDLFQCETGSSPQATR